MVLFSSIRVKGWPNIQPWLVAPVIGTTISKHPYEPISTWNLIRFIFVVSRRFVVEGKPLPKNPTYQDVKKKKFIEPQTFQFFFFSFLGCACSYCWIIATTSLIEDFPELVQRVYPLGCSWNFPGWFGAFYESEMVIRSNCQGVDINYKYFFQ